MMLFSSDPGVANQQLRAVIYYLTAFGYVDREYAFHEKDFVRDYIHALVRTRIDVVMPGLAEDARKDAIKQSTAHFHAVADEIDSDIRSLFTEAVAKDESVQEFVYGKLELHCYEIFKSFDEANRRELMAIAEELIQIDGKMHPAEIRFRDQVLGLLAASEPAAEQQARPSARLPRIEALMEQPGRLLDHAFFAPIEVHYSADPRLIQQQAFADLQLAEAVIKKFQELRAGGSGRLAGIQEVGQLAGQAPFIDGTVAVLPPRPGTDYELIILGDTHGCYSCLKAAVMQSDFLAKVQAHREDPARNPEVKLILLGDYVDRGRFSFDGVMRAAMQLFLAAPEHVYLMRGNHEWYLDLGGFIRAGVHPAEAIASLRDHVPMGLFEGYKRLFESMPIVLLFDRVLFVHAGIPRDKTLRERWKDLSSFNDPDLRFEMLWSDPSEADYIPDKLQGFNARFPFGRHQFERFMNVIGCTTLIRGHEKIIEGFRAVYQDDQRLLLNLFSSGGKHNDDLPPRSNYRDVSPMALTLRHKDGVATVTPWVIDYVRYMDPARNGFYRSAAEIDLRSE